MEIQDEFELLKSFELLRPFQGMGPLSNCIKNIVMSTPEERAVLLTKNTFMGKNINKYIELEQTTYPTTFWQIFCAYGLIDCVNKTAAYMKGKKELPTINRQNVDVPIEYDALYLAAMYEHHLVVEKLLAIQKISALTAMNILNVAAENNDMHIAKLMLAVPGVDLTGSKGTTLSWAIVHQNLVLSKALLLAGADPTGLPYTKVFEDPSQIALFLIFDPHPVDRSYVIDIDMSLAKCVLQAMQYTKGVHAKSRFLSATDKQVYKIAQNLLSEVLDHLDNPEEQFHLIMAHLRKISKGLLGAYELTTFDTNLLLLIYDIDNLWLHLKINKPSDTDIKTLPGLVLDSLLQQRGPQATTKESKVESAMVGVANPIEITIYEPFTHNENVINLCKILLAVPQEQLLKLLLDNRKFVARMGDGLVGQNGITALHIFSAYGLTDCAYRMIKLGDDPNAIMHTTDYYTPMDLAILFNHPDTIEMLKKHDAEIFYPEHYATEEENSHSSTDSDSENYRDHYNY